jgi:hypothetical protein
MFLVDELAVKVRCLWGYLSGSIEPSLVRFEVRIGQQTSVRNACRTYHLSPKKYRSYLRRSRLPIEDPILYSRNCIHCLAYTQAMALKNSSTWLAPYRIRATRS